MVLVREPMVMYHGGFDAEASAFDALGYSGHDVLLGGVDAAALWRGYAYHEPAGAASAYMRDNGAWASSGPSVLSFDHAVRGHAGSTRPRAASA